jgi:hypothetical protein
LKQNGTTLYERAEQIAKKFIEKFLITYDSQKKETLLRCIRTSFAFPGENHIIKLFKLSQEELVITINSEEAEKKGVTPYHSIAFTSSNQFPNNLFNC